MVIYLYKLTNIKFCLYYIVIQLINNIDEQ